MKTIIRSLFIGAILCICSLSIQAQSKQIYQVKAGDTFFSIAKALNVSVAELKQWNNIDTNELAVGQELSYYLVIPTDTLQQVEAPIDTTSLVDIKPNTTNTFYLVKSGDTLSKIALDNNMSIAELKAINNLNSDNLRIGQRLAIKSVSSAPVVSAFSGESTPQGQFALYDLGKNEDLSFILNKFQMTKQELQELNPEVDLNKLNLAKSITVLLPPTRHFANPYLDKAKLQDLGTVDVSTYSPGTGVRTTTNGELYNPEELTAAHSNISLGSIIYIENVTSGKGIYVRINDRITDAGLKLSAQAYRILGFENDLNPKALIFTDS